MRQDKNILITGCSSGIGLCVARGLKTRGYRVLATARKSRDVDRLQQQGLESLPLDLSKPESIQRAIEDTLERTDGELYALFNNGAYGQPGAVEDLRREVLREQFETNFFGTHDLTIGCLAMMRRQGYGRIIQNSSVLGLVALPYRGAYNASKYALEGLTDTLRLELVDTQIYISLIEPGPILSRFRANAYEAFKSNIDRENSAHRNQYEIMEQRFVVKGPAVPFTLPPEAVLKKVVHALESKRPRARYFVTFPTYLFVALKRLLPSRTLDRMLWRLGGQGLR